MENYNANYTTIETNTLNTTKTFMASVFAWMSLALTITAITSYLFGTNIELLRLLVSETGGFSIFGWVVLLAPIGFVLAMSFAFQRLSYPLLVVFFMAYALFTGMSLSFIFVIYTMGSIASTFLIAAGMFGAMAVVGYTTKTDLTSFGKIMMMGLIGILIASLVNFFLKSDAMSYVISTIGVLVFTGLTAYDVQKLKRIGAGIEYGNQMASKLSIMGALSLYLDFINIFLYLLRLFGSRRD
jgi:FtsH-binding integral membrane protein